MTKYFIVVLLFVLVVSGHAQNANHELLNIKYRGDRELSTLTFTFDEPFLFQYKRQTANQLRMVFPNTTSSGYANRIPLIFKSGHAKNIAFDYSRPDTIAVLLTLNSNVLYGVRRPKGKPEIVVEMYGTDAQGSGGTPVDIATLVRQELEGVQTAETGSTKQAQTPGLFDIQVVPLLVAGTFSLMGTAVLMLWFAKPTAVNRKRSLSVPPVPQKNSEATDAVDAILAQAKIILHEKTGNPRHMAEQPDDDREDIAAELARTFRRGEEELRMASKLQGASREHQWEKRLRLLQQRQRDSIARARKLGVGRGELALAASLRRMNEKHEKKEQHV